MDSIIHAADIRERLPGASIVPGLRKQQTDPNTDCRTSRHFPSFKFMPRLKDLPPMLRVKFGAILSLIPRTSCPPVLRMFEA